MKLREKSRPFRESGREQYDKPSIPQAFSGYSIKKPLELKKSGRDNVR